MAQNTNATNFVFFHSLSYFKFFMGKKKLTCRAILLSNIINKVIHIILIMFSAFIISEFGPPVSLFKKNIKPH